MKFSDRMGITPTTKEIQLNSIDQELRNGLWNIYNEYIFDKILEGNQEWSSLRGYAEDFTRYIWHNLFKLTIDRIPNDYLKLREYFRNIIIKGEWHDAYNLIEASYQHLVTSKTIDNADGKNLENTFNVLMEREFAGYRFINGYLAKITNQHEIGEIEEALKSTGSFSPLIGCNIHLNEALRMLSDRINPDYRNSIKESISAIESLAKIISGNAKDSLGGAIDKIKGKIKLHSALERGFKQIYGYTSDEGGIRHALIDSPNCDFEDAKFMLISCSAFINYLIGKANKAGISLT